MNYGHDGDTQDIPGDAAELIARIHDEWASLEQIVYQLDEEQLSQPIADGWSVKDHLAHLSTWEKHLLLYHLQGVPGTESLQIDQETWEQAGEDELNAIIYERNRDRPASAVLVDFRRTHQELVDYLQQVPFEELHQPRSPDDPQSGPLIEKVIGNTYDHYREHRQTIVARGNS